MKRVMAGLAFALTLIRMLTAAASAQEYQTVSQLRESVPARWTTTIETKWRDVAIDAEIVTPDVEAIPVVKVGYDLHPSPLTPEESGWTIVDDSYQTKGMLIYQDDDLGKPPRKIDGRKVGGMAVPKGAWYDTCEPDRAYIPMCDVTYSEIIDMVSAELERFGYPVEDFDLETPAELRLFQWCFAGTKEDAAPGYFDISFYPKVKGVTVYGHILDAVHDTPVVAALLAGVSPFDMDAEGLKKVEKAKRAVETERLEIMDRHHETVKKSAETYDKIVKKRLMEKEIEERRLQQKDFLAERNEEAERRRDEMRKTAEKD